MSTSIQLQKSSVARQLFDFLRHEDFLCRNCYFEFRNVSFRNDQNQTSRYVTYIGAGAIELAGARAPKFLTARPNTNLPGHP